VSYIDHKFPTAHWLYALRSFNFGTGNAVAQALSAATSSGNPTPGTKEGQRLAQKNAAEVGVELGCPDGAVVLDGCVVGASVKVGPLVAVGAEDGPDTGTIVGLSSAFPGVGAKDGSCVGSNVGAVSSVHTPTAIFTEVNVTSAPGVGHRFRKTT